MKPLNKIGDIDLNRPALIEASAGTGKTHAIEELYVRALREIDGAEVESVLVVTFTNAAAAELRGRLRARLMKERDATAGDADARRMWTDALLTFDKANITTIHGFCERMLSEFAFEGALPFETEQEDAASAVADEMVLDYWRRYVYDERKMPAELAESQDAKPGDIAELTKEALAKPLAQIVPGTSLDDLEKLIDDLVAAMPNEFEELKINRTDKRTKVFEDLKAMFNSPGWHDRHVLLKHQDIKSASDRFADKGTKIEHDFTRLLIAVRGCAPTLKNVMSYEAAKFMTKADERGVTPVSGRRRTEGVRTFDDMINDLRLTLEHSESAVRQMRARFKIAMIDEFQDTDPVQWDIFKKLFLDGGPPHRIILVGDPKQAIYSFRGGDIDTYCRVRGEIATCGEVFTMGTNYRSEPVAVDAVNRIFMSGPDSQESAFNVRPAGGGVDIRYNHVHDRTSNPAVDAIAILQRADEAALENPAERGGGVGVVVKLAGGQYGDRVGKDMVFEIRELMDPRKWRIFGYKRGEDGGWTRDDGRAVVAGDIMVLAARTAVVEEAHGNLCRNAIPCTMRSDNSVFGEVEAQWLLRLMSAALARGSRGLGELLATPMFGYGAEAIFREVNAESDGNMAGAMREALDVWRRDGLQAFFVEVVRAHGVRARLLSAPLGERHWTNLSQIVEILSAEESSGRLTPEGVRAMLVECIGGNYRKGDSHEFRLDSDEDSAVAMTTHKSKGLQAPIVFVAEIKNNVGSSKKAFGSNVSLFHENGETLLAVEPNAEQKKLEKEELLEEAVRQFYVAVTRAKHRTYVYLAQDKFPKGDEKGEGVLGHVAEASPVLREVGKAAQELADENNAATDAAVKVVADSIGVAKPVPNDVDMPAVHGAPTPPKLKQPPKAAPKAVAWVQGSFSWLKGLAAADAHEAPQFDGSREYEPAEHEAVPDGAIAGGDVPLRYTMPGGPVFGNAVHSIFERCAFDADEAAIRELALQSLKEWGLEAITGNAAQVDAVVEMVRDTLAAEIPDADGGTFRLADIGSAARLSETTFHFPVGGGATIAKLASTLSGWGGIYEQSMAGMTAGSRETSIGGMMKGIIDLVVEHRGKFYILDWKTNIIDANPASFAVDADQSGRGMLAREIAGAMYPLQWALYTLAVDRYLCKAVRGYDYGKHFGGVRYMFLRGIEPARPGAGIWVQPPPTAGQLTALNSLFS